MLDIILTAPSTSSRAAKIGRWTRQRASDSMDAGLRAFYAADPRRGPSLERDLGLNWTSVHGATYRAAWIADTQELYAVRHSGDAEEARVTVLARLAPEALERALAGWRRISESGLPGSYEWLLERARGALQGTAPAF
jgi:hypothetical protein